MKSTHYGSCHCEAVRFRVEVDLAQGSGRCNCSFCAKVRWWGVMARPEDVLVLYGADALSAYQFGARVARHQFCRYCGVHLFCRGEVAQLGGAFVSVSIAALDGVGDEALAVLPIQYADGRRNNWQARPAVTTHL